MNKPVSNIAPSIYTKAELAQMLTDALNDNDYYRKMVHDYQGRLVNFICNNLHENENRSIMRIDRN